MTKLVMWKMRMRIPIEPQCVLCISYE